MSALLKPAGQPAMLLAQPGQRLLCVRDLVGVVRGLRNLERELGLADRVDELLELLGAGGHRPPPSSSGSSDVSA